MNSPYIATQQGLATTIAPRPVSFRKYLTLSGASFRSSLTYFKAFVLSKLFLVILIFIFANLYRALYAGLNSVAGITLQALLYYIALSESMEMCRPQVHQTISEEVKDGTCAYNLMRPISYFWYHYAASSGEMVINFLLAFAISLTVVSLMAGFNASLLIGMVLSLPLIFLAVTLNFLVLFNIGLLAFYIEEVSPVFWIYQKLLFIIGGLFIPLDFFPDWLRSAVQYLPTAFIQYYPVRVAIDINSGQYLRVLGWQLGYIALFAFIAGSLYRAGIKKLEVNGG